MRNLKRALSLVMAAAMLIGMMVVSAGAVDYADQADIDYTEAVGVMSAIEVLEGNGKNFNPDGILTREQAAKIITYVVMGKTKAEKLPASANFTDVKATDWAAKYIAYCAGKNIIAGDGTGKFNPKGELTGFAFGKMLLVALGFDPAACGLTGSAWEINTATLLAAEDLDAGLENLSLSAPMTREQAAQMALNAMKWTAEGTVWCYRVDDDVYEFDSKSDAQIFFALASGTTKVWIGEVKTTEGSLLKEVFNVDAYRGSDAFERPSNCYDLNDKDDTVLTYADVPVATFTGAVTEKEMFNVVKADKVTGSTTQAVITYAYQDGFNATSWVNNGHGIVVNKTGANAAYVTPFTGAGMSSEVYELTDSNGDPYYVLVSIRDYLGTVTGVTNANAVNETPRSISVTLTKAPETGANTACAAYVTDDFALNDVVVVNISRKADKTVQAIKAATSISGTVTKTTNTGVYTIGGNDYVMSNMNANSAPTLASTGSWYVDSYGNLLGDKAVTGSGWSYGYLTGYKTQAAGSDLITSTENAEKFQIITSTGDKVILDGAFTENSAGVATFVGANLGYNASSNRNFLVRYTLDGNGKVNVIQAVATSGNTATGATLSSTTITNGNALLTSGVYVTDNTVFFVYKDANNYAVYTGYKNIPASTAMNAGGQYFYGTTATGAADTTTVAAVVLPVTSAAAQTAGKYVWFASADNYQTTTTDGTVTTYTNVYLDGVKGEIQFLNLATGSAPSAGTLYAYTTDTKTGYATLGVNSGELATTATVSRIESGYYVTNHNTAPVIYTDSTTVYYQIDSTTGAVEKVDNLPTVNNQAYDIKQVSVINSDSSLDQAHPADVVYFAVVAK